MSQQYMHLTHNRVGGYWEATSTVNGSLYRVCGPSASATFQEMCDVLKVPADRWRIKVVSPGAMRCEYIPPSARDESTLSTESDFPPIDFLGGESA